MTLDLAAVAREAAARWRQDRALLLPLAGLLLFVPQWAVLLCIPEPPALAGNAAGTAAMTAWANAAQAWAQDYGPAYVAAFLVARWGQLALVALYLGGSERPTVGRALVRSARRLARFVVAELLVWMPIVAAVLAGSALPPLLIVVVPGVVYLLGRTLLVGPAILVGRRTGALAGLALSWRWTRGNGAGLALLAAALVIGAPILVELVRQTGEAMRLVHLANPVVIAALDALAAVIAAGAMLALAMSMGVLYRRLAR